MEGTTAWRDCLRAELVEEETGRVLVPRLRLACRTAARMKGLLGERELADDAGLLIEPCNSIHMFFMRFAIDAVYLGRNWRILKIVPELRPWGMSLCWKAGAVLELPAGAANRLDLRTGQKVAVVPGAAAEQREF